VRAEWIAVNLHNAVEVRSNVVRWRSTMVRGRWGHGGGGRSGNKPSEAEKLVITSACEKFVDEVLRPRFLPKIRTTAQFNYPIAIYGKWLGDKYRFITRFRSDDPDSIEPEFEAPFSRLEYVGRDRFDLSYLRHTGKWFCLFRSVRWRRLWS
jgi:hypothetical protein